MTPVVFNNLERSIWKVAAGALADTNTQHGNVPVAAQSLPSVACATLSLDPRGQPYANAYFYKEHGPHPSVSTFIYSAAFLFPTVQDSQRCQALELDLQQVIRGEVANFGLQLDFAEGFVRVWNRAAHEAGKEGWQATSKPVSRWAEGQWLEITLAVRRDKGKVAYQSLVLGGQTIPLGNVAFKTAKLSLADMLNCAIQLDGNRSGESYRVVVDAVSLTAS